MRVNRHKQKPKPTAHVYSSLSNEEEGVAATGSYDIYTRCLRRLWREVQGRFYIMQQQQQNEGDIASDPAHYPSLCDKHDHFFYFNIFILKYYECS